MRLFDKYSYADLTAMRDELWKVFSKINERIVYQQTSSEDKQRQVKEYLDPISEKLNKIEGELARRLEFL